MEYTKGKWTTESATVVVKDSQGNRQVVCSTFNEETPISEYLANARLIAAAPMMYEAMKQWQKYAESNYSGDGMDAVKMGQAALEAVEGE